MATRIVDSSKVRDLLPISTELSEYKGKIDTNLYKELAYRDSASIGKKRFKPSSSQLNYVPSTSICTPTQH